MFTKIGVTVATGALPVLLWAGAASGQDQSQSQSQSASTVATTPTTISSTIDGTGTGGALARTGPTTEDFLPLAAGGIAVAGAVVIYGVRRRSLA